MTAVDWRYGKGVYARDRKLSRGIVEYNRDPDHRGRVMVRVMEDGAELKYRENKTPMVATFSLGWCNPMFGMASGTGFGAFTVPPVGARVWVMYERGDPQSQVYFGGWTANPNRKRRYGVTTTTLDPPKKEFEDSPGYTKEGELSEAGEYQYPPQPTPYQGHWDEPQGPEIPLELAEMIKHTPDTQMFFKTLKGATMIVKERDEMEELFIIDRLGAELRFESNTELKEEGVLRRGMQSATHLEPMGLMDNRLALDMDRGEQRLRLLYYEEGKVVGHIEFDVVGRRLDIRGLDFVSIYADVDLHIRCPKVRIHGDLDVEGEIRYLGDYKNTYLERDIEPHGTPHRNYWPYRERFMPYTEDATRWGEDWDRTEGYK
jgi:hypothetical protein